MREPARSHGSLRLMEEEQGGSGRSEISGHDVDQAREMFEGAYNGRGFVIEPSDREFSYRYTSVGDDEMTLRGTLFSGTVRGSVQTEGEYVVSWITAGAGATDLDVDPVQLALGQPAVFVNNRPSSFSFRDYRQNLMHFDGDFLERVAGDHEGTRGPLLFDTTVSPSGETLRRWASTVATVARIVYDENSSPLLRAEANRTAAIALLDTFPHTSLHAPTEIPVPSGGRMRTAIEFMHANAHRALPVESIAEAAGMSLRTLQHDFRRDLGTTPLDYLRRIRLDRVRDELIAADAGTTTVADVAHRWGFAHLGRFSASYAERFGEYPKTTLDD